MKKQLSLLVILLLLSTAIFAADNKTNKTDNKQKYVPSDAPDSVLQAAKDEIVKHVGLDYYNQYVKQLDSRAGKGGSYQVWFEFQIPFKDDIASGAQYIRIFLSGNGVVTAYRGPTKAIIFNVTQDQAIKTAVAEGISFPTDAKIMFTDDDIESDLGKTIYHGQYLWKVFANKPKKGEPTAVFIDVETGEIVGVTSETKDHAIKGKEKVQEKPKETSTRPSETPEENQEPTAATGGNWIVRVWHAIVRFFKNLFA